MKEKRKSRVFPVIVLIIVILFAGGAAFLWYFATSGLPVTKGVIKTDVAAEVEIYRDEYGVPHIIADNIEDLFFAQGYVHAQDRLWQMDVSRRAIGGRLAEIIGEDALEMDRFALTVGFRRAAALSYDAVSEECREVMLAYARGINAYIDENKLSPEFRLLGYKPEPWEPLDSLSISKYMAWSLGGNMQTELFLSALLAKVDREKALELFPAYPEYGPVITDPRFETAFSKDSVPALTELSRLAEMGGSAAFVEGRGSNNWVISGELTESGTALLANDMHLGMDVPSIWYANHLMIKDEINATGVMFPGIPGIIVGFNDYYAWGVTNVNPDVQDLYLIKFDEEEPYMYEYMGELHDAEVLELSIPVKGWEEPDIIEVVITRHGPVVSGVVDMEEAVSLRWTALDATAEGNMLLEIGWGKDWKDFSAALEHFKAPAQNFVYADREGNIGYRATGLFPIRKKGDGLLPVPGWTDEYEWDGYVPWDKMPKLYNPPEGFIVTANHRVVDDDYPYFITNEWSAPYRARGILKELAERSSYTIEDMKEIQGSLYNSQAEILLPVITEIIGKLEDLDENELAVLELLNEWQENPVDEAGLGAPLIYHTLYLNIIEYTFKDELEEDLYERLLRYSGLVNAMDRMILSGKSSWFNDSTAPGKQTRDDIIEKSFRKTVERLVKKMETPPGEWRWGDIHTFTAKHHLSQVKIFEKIVNRGPFPVGGSAFSPAAMAYPLTDPFEVTHSAPWRYVVDVKEGAGYDSLAIGNSGHPFSEHYDDQTELWLNMDFKKMTFSPEETSELPQRLLLTPR